MTPAQRRRTVALVALLVVFAIVAAVQLRRGATPAPAATTARPSNQTSRGRGAAPAPQVSDLRLDLLSKGGGDYPEPERDPFKFEQRPAPAPPRATTGRRGQAPAAPAGPPVPPGPPPLPPIPWRFIGVFDLPGAAGRVGIFSDGRGNTTQGKEGDIIDGRYRVLRVGPDSAELAYLDGRGRQSLRLSGQ